MPKGKKNPTDLLVGQRIRTARLLANMSQEKLGHELGVTFQQVQKYEKGANRVGAGRLSDIARILELPVIHFFGDEPTTKASPDDPLRRLGQSRQGLALAAAFTAITDNNVRAALLALAQVAAAKDAAPMRKAA